MRVCKKAGAKGFAEFKVLLAGELQKENQLNHTLDVNVPFEEGNSYEVIAGKLANIFRDSISEANSVMRYPLMENVVRCLLKCSSIDIYGECDSLLAAYEFRSKMLRIRKNVRIEQGYAEGCESS